MMIGNGLAKSKYTLNYFMENIATMGSNSDMP